MEFILNRTRMRINVETAVLWEFESFIRIVNNTKELN